MKIEERTYKNFTDLYVDYQTIIRPATVAAIPQVGKRSIGLDVGGSVGITSLTLAQALKAARIDLVDTDCDRINAAREYSRGSVVAPRCGDGLEYLRDHVGVYDWIWTADLLWPNQINDPVSWVEAMGKALRPDGELIVFTGNFMGSRFLPDFAREEQLLQQIGWASMGLPPEGDICHPFAVRQWFRSTGLRGSGPFAVDVSFDPNGVDGAAVGRYLAFIAGEYKRYLKEARRQSVDLPYSDLERLFTIDDKAYFGRNSGPFVHKAIYWRGQAPI